jgi:hypothetical protein
MQVDSQSALAAVRRDRGVPSRLLEVTEHSWLVNMAWVVPELEKREAERIHQDHRCGVADPAEPR